MGWLYNVITQGNPQQFQFAFCLRTLNLLGTLIARERGIHRSKCAASRLLGHLGLSPERSIYKSYLQDPLKVHVYLAETFPESVAQARAWGADIYFVDEVTVRSDVRRGLTCGKIGETPVVRDRAAGASRCRSL